jgi:NADH:ubiquinone oxidoreductase subunit K
MSQYLYEKVESEAVEGFFRNQHMKEKDSKKHQEKCKKRCVYGECFFGIKKHNIYILTKIFYLYQIYGEVLKMKKKIVIGCISLIFMLLAISFATVANTQTTQTIEKNVSPLFKVRIRELKTEDITFRHIGQNRLIFMPFYFLSDNNLPSARQQIQMKWTVGRPRCSMDQPCTIIFCFNVAADNAPRADDYFITSQKDCAFN